MRILSNVIDPFFAKSIFNDIATIDILYQKSAKR
jgi:hypothetical protein